MTEIRLSISMPDKCPTEYNKPDLEQKVREYMMLVEGDRDSYHHWNYLKALYNKACSSTKPLNPKYKQLLFELEEFIMKHQGADSHIDDQDISADLDSGKLLRNRL